MLSTDFILNIERVSMVRVCVEGEKILKLKELLIRNEDNDILFDESWAVKEEGREEIMNKFNDEQSSTTNTK